MKRFLVTALVAGAVLSGSVVIADSEPVDHVTVQQGDTLFAIARDLCPHAVAVMVDDLQASNNIEDLIFPGQVLHYHPGACPEPTTTTTTEATTSTTTSSTTTSTTTEPTSTTTEPTTTSEPATTSTISTSPSTSSTEATTSTTEPTTTTEPSTSTTTIPSTSTTSTTTSSTTEPPTTTTEATTTTTEPTPSEFPTPETVGPRCAPTMALPRTTTLANGQIFECLTIDDQLTIRHDNIIVRDVTVFGGRTYMIHVQPKTDGTCPQNVLIEYTEIDGSGDPLANHYALRGQGGCGFTFDHGHIHDVGRGVHLTNNTTISNSYIDVDRPREPGDHRNGIMTNGGVDGQPSNLDIVNNVVYCGVPGDTCSAAVSLFADFETISDVLIEHNLMASSGTYCFRGGYEDHQGQDTHDVVVIDNHWSTRYHPDCGSTGPVASMGPESQGNVYEGNVWHDGPLAGQPHEL